MTLNTRLSTAMLPKISECLIVAACDTSIMYLRGSQQVRYTHTGKVLHDFCRTGLSFKALTG